MSRVSLGANVGTETAPRHPRGAWNIDLPNQFEAAERIAKRRGITREDVDEFGLQSQAQAKQAWAEGRFDREICGSTAPVLDERRPPTAKRRSSPATRVCATPPPKALARLKPVLEGGIHTAGNSSQITDGAAAVLWMDEDKARALGLKPRARIVSQALVGAEPVLPPRRAGRGDRQGAREGRHEDRRHRPRRDQRGLRVRRALLGAGHDPTWRRSTSTVARSRSVTRSAAPAAGSSPPPCTNWNAGPQIALITMCAGGALSTGTIIERI